MFPRWFGWLFCLFLGYLVFVGTTPPEAPKTAEQAAPAISEKTYPALATLTSADHWKRSLDPDYAARVNCDPPPPTDGLGLKIVDDVLGVGAPAACGDTITIQLTVWSSAAAKTEGGELRLDLGARSIALGLDAGLVGIRPGGVRTLVLPPAALARAKEAVLPTVLRPALPANKLAVVTVKRVQ